MLYVFFRKERTLTEALAHTRLLQPVYSSLVRGTRDQSGAVEARAQRVHTDYIRHARRMDAHHYPGATPRIAE